MVQILAEVKRSLIRNQLWKSTQFVTLVKGAVDPGMLTPSTPAICMQLMLSLGIYPILRLFNREVWTSLGDLDYNLSYRGRRVIGISFSSKARNTSPPFLTLAPPPRKVRQRVLKISL